MLGLQQGSLSKAIHETSASNPQISSPSSQSTFHHVDEHDNASYDHSDCAVTHLIRVNGRRSASTFPVHLLSACSSSSRNMCPFSNSITSQEILSGVRGAPNQGMCAVILPKAFPRFR